jgi:hypothetical protein
MLHRLTFRRTEEGCLHIVAHPDQAGQGSPIMVVDHADPTVFAAALGLAGTSTDAESTLSVVAQQAWEHHGLEVCCEAVDLMTDQMESLGFRPKN